MVVVEALWLAPILIVITVCAGLTMVKLLLGRVNLGLSSVLIVLAMLRSLNVFGALLTLLGVGLV